MTDDERKIIDDIQYLKSALQPLLQSERLRYLDLLRRVLEETERRGGKVLPRDWDDLRQLRLAYEEAKAALVIVEEAEKYQMYFGA
jgi:hypothetical protein